MAIAHSWVAPFLPLALTLAAGTLAAAQDNPDPVRSIVIWEGHEVVEGELLVQFVPGAVLAERDALHRALGTVLVGTIRPGLDHVRFDRASLDDLLAAYGAHPLVELVEPNAFYRPIHTPDDPQFAQQWGAQAMNCEQAWDVHRGNPSVVVAVIDTGVDRNHADLNDHYAYGFDYFANDSNPQDAAGHGTFVTGLAAAETNNATGIAGVAYDCRYAAYRAGDTGFATDDIVQSIQDACARGAHVINMSFGSGFGSGVMRAALAAALDAGVVNVAGAGNSGSTALFFPAAFGEVIGAAASTSSCTRWPSSNYGDWVSVAAPGASVRSTTLGGGYGNSSGTSFASPHVAGMAALLYSFLGGVRSECNARIIRDVIESTALPVDWVRHGKVDLEAAINAIAPAATPVISSVTPTSVQAFLGAAVTLGGSDFLCATTLQVGTNVLSEPQFTIVDGSTITFAPPTATALGPTPVTVTNPAGTSAPAFFDYIETHPPRQFAPPIDLAVTGQPFTWSFGGGAGDIYLLVGSPSDATIDFMGFSILANSIRLFVGLLDPAGTGTRSVIVPPGLVGLLIRTQILTFDETNLAFVGASNIRSTGILP